MSEGPVQSKMQQWGKWLHGGAANQAGRIVSLQDGRCVSPLQHLADFGEDHIPVLVIDSQQAADGIANAG